MTAANVDDVEGPTPDRIHVLHVDDDGDFAELTAEFLEREDPRFTVETVTDTDAGLDRLAESAFDCVVSDYDMPRMDGIAFLEAVRAADHDLPFILYTGKGSEEVASEAISTGATDYLQKEEGTSQYAVLANRIENAVSQYRAEQEVETVQARYQRLIEESTDAIVIIDATGNFDYVSPAAERVLGYEPAALVGENGFEYIHEDDRAVVKDRFSAMVADPEFQPSVEFRFEHGDGSWRWLEARGRNLVSEPAIDGLVVYARDVTERRNQLERILSIVDQLPAGVLVETPSREVLTANEQFCTLFDIPDPSAVSGRDCDIAAHEIRERFVDPDGFVERIDELLVAGEPVYGEAVDLADGRVFERSYLPIELPTGKGHLWIYRDVTEREEWERELERERDRFTALYDNFPEPTLTYEFVEGEPVIRAVNDAFVEGFGWDANTAVGRSIDDLLVPEEKLDEAKAIDDRVRAGELVDLELRRRTADGYGVFWFRNIPVPGPDGPDGFAVYIDITERKERERALERERSRIEFALRVTDSYIYEIDPATGEERRYGDWEELHGVAASEVPTTEAFIERAVHPDDRATVERVHDELDYEPGATVEFEYRTNPDRGEVRWILTELSVHTDAGDDSPRGVGLATDITGRKQRERRIRQERNRLRAITDAIPDVVIVYDADGQYQAVLTGQEQLLVDARKNLEGATVAETLPPEAAATVTDAIERTLETGAVHTVEYALELNGKRTWFEGRIAPFPTEGDEQVVFLARDVTDHVERERTLERLQRATRNLVTAATPDDVAQEVAEAARDVLGYAYPVVRYREGDRLEPAYAVSELREVAASIPTYQIGEDLAGKAYESGEVHVYGDVRAIDDGRNRGATRSVMYVPIGEYGIISVADTAPDAFDETDATFVELLASSAETALNVIHQRQALQRQNERLEQFASVISHDLRNPLNVAQGQLEFAAAECDNDHLESVAQAHDRIESLIEDVLSLARAGSTVGPVEPVELAELVENCRRTVEAETVRFVVETEARVPANPSRLQQLLENLIRNVVDHGGEDVTITVGDLEDGFYVEDDGRGIAEDDREQIFEPGYSTTSESPGLGLSICKEIAEAHGWTIVVSEGAADGTRFEITGVDDR